MKRLVRWGVVGTMDEPAPLILSWVAHHLAIGASEVHVFLDRANPDAQTALADVANCHVTLCDARYWEESSRAERPIRHTARQKYNATQVYKTRPLDWVMQCDADEFLDLTGGFEQELLESRARTIRLRNVERVRRGPSDDIFHGTFRGIEENTGLTDQVYGRWAAFLDAGMAGYHDGKDIVRSGENFTMGVHFPIDATTMERHHEPYVEMRNARILHFDGLTPLHIVLKLLKRANEPKYKVPRKHGTQREKQFRYAGNHTDKPKQMMKMVESVYGLDKDQADQIGGSHLEISFNPRTALADVGITADLSVANFDKELRNREADLIELTGLKWP